MARRVIALALWAYFGWYLTAMLAMAFGLPTQAAPIGGLLMGTLALVDWRRWRRQEMGEVGAQAVSE
jgi:hypothetical protein